MLNAIRNEYYILRDALKKSREYHKNKNKNAFVGTLAESKEIYSKYKEELVPKKSNLSTKDEELFKRKFHYWDEWTGARFSRRVSPYITMTDAELSKVNMKREDIELGSVCRWNAVYSRWEKY